jgi:hypothetical protein
VLSGFNPVLHWLVSGWQQGKNPHPLFDTAWYLGEHPELVAAGANPFLHYLSEGAAAGWDPNPLFNTDAYVEAAKGVCDRVNALQHFMQSGLRVAPGAYRTADALIDAQQAYRSKTRTDIAFDVRRADRRYAVFLQCGRGSVHPRWLTDGDKDWDLIVNHYDATYAGRIPCQVESVQQGSLPGTKFTALDSLLRRNPGFLDEYDHVLLLDDDIELTEADISRLFAMAANQHVDLLQASLSPDSYASHPIFRTRHCKGLRFVNGVEIMMPMLSRRALRVARALFRETISGWGFDLALATLVKNQFGGNAAIADEIVVKHAKPIDLANGTYYRMLADADIFPLLEYRHLQIAYQTDRGFFEV